MERAILSLLCLAAAVCLVQCQTPPCPEDVLTDRLKYYGDSYISDPTLLDYHACVAVFTPSFLYGQPIFFTIWISECIPGFTSFEIDPVNNLYVCEVDAPVVDVEETSGDVEPDLDVVPGPGGSVAPTTAAPTTAAPTDPSTTAAPTEEERQACLSDHQTSNYMYSTVRDGLIEQITCYIAIASQGTSIGHQESYYWDCIEGYTRQHVRRQMYRCAPINP